VPPPRPHIKPERVELYQDRGIKSVAPNPIYEALMLG
jgi:hypothetical protein